MPSHGLDYFFIRLPLFRWRRDRQLDLVWTDELKRRALGARFDYDGYSSDG
jgi:hypothetical protein